MKLLIDLEEDGEVTPEAVRQAVEDAVAHWRDNVGLSGDEDEGYINSIEVTIVAEDD